MTVRILQGDCREMLATLPDASVNTCVTSPPYFGLRDYGVDGQMGLEPTPAEFVAGMVSVFREVRRVLRDDGTLWLNIGDSYAGSGRGGNPDAGTKQGTNRGSQSVGVLYGREHESAEQERERIKAANAALAQAGCKAKDLLGIPWMLAFALRADGWYLRQDIIWSKPNPMPESVRDRCTKAHEFIFLLSKSPRYYFDAAAISERVAEAGVVESSNLVSQTKVRRGKVIGRGVHGSSQARGMVGKRADRSNSGGFPTEGTRNKRSVWEVATQPFGEAHFATYPPALIEPCILAGCPKGGAVLDPFFGAGTTGLVADRLQRDCIGIELNPEYAEIARKRLQGDGGMFTEIAA